MRSRCQFLRECKIRQRLFFGSPLGSCEKAEEAERSHGGNGEVQVFRAGVQRAQPFVHGYRECNIPVQVKGGSLAQLSGVAPLSTGYYLAQKCSKEAASLPLPEIDAHIPAGGCRQVAFDSKHNHDQSRKLADHRCHFIQTIL